MSRNRNRLIEDLAADLRPTPRPGRVVPWTAAWLLVVTGATLLVTALVQPFRAGALGQLVAEPRFMVESLAGVAAIVALTIGAFKSAIPDPGRARRWTIATLLLLAVWLSFYLVGLVSPALEPTMSGKRDDWCRWETLVYGCVALGAGLLLLRRLWPLHGARSGLLIGLAAGMIQALTMQFACMYVPSHILTHHVLPGLLVGVAGLLIGRWWLKPRL